MGVAGDMNLGGRERRMSLVIALSHTGNNMFMMAVTETVLVTEISETTLKSVAKLLAGGYQGIREYNPHVKLI